MMKFEYNPAPQRSPEWFALRLGKVTASRLSDWLAVSKAKDTKGKPLKARLDYEKELMFERQFNVSFNNYITDAMQDGIDLEDFAVKQYILTNFEKGDKSHIEECGAWYNDFFCASPDRIVNDDGLLEVKVVRDNTFTDILINGVPEKHWQQIQGQLWASKRDWCDYVVLNLNTKKLVVIEVKPDLEFWDYLEEAVQEKLVVDKFSEEKMFDIVGALPDGMDSPALASNNEGSW